MDNEAPLRKLNRKQKRFVAEYAVDGIGGAAARRAGYSERTANVIASQLLTKPHVRAAVDAEQARILALAEVDAVKAARRLWTLSEAAEAAGNYPAAVAAMTTLVKRFPEFREGATVNVDARTLIVTRGQLEA